MARPTSLRPSDVTTSVPPDFDALTREWVTRQVDRAVSRAVSGPMQPSTFYLRRTASASYSTAAGLLTVRPREAQRATGRAARFGAGASR